MKKNLRKICLLILAAAMAFVLGACAEIRLAKPMDSDVLLIIDDTECSTAECIFRLMEIKELYHADEDEIFWYRSIGDTDLEHYVKDSVLDEMTKYTASVIMADEMALTLSIDEQSEVMNYAQQAYNEMSQKYDLAKYGITLQNVEDLYMKKALYELVFNDVSKDVTMEISATDTKVILLNYVEIPPKTSIDDIEAMRSLIRGGADFGEVCEENGYEPHMNCVTKRGDYPSQFENVAYALLDGELSEAIETKDCIYLIQCVEDYMVNESVANYNEVISRARKDKFNEAFIEFSADRLLRMNSKVWDDISVPDL